MLRVGCAVRAIVAGMTRDGRRACRGLRLLVGLALAVTMVVAMGLLASPAFAAGPTSDSIDISPNPASAGQTVTLRVTVSGTLFSPLGLVQFFDGDSLLGPLLLLSPDFDDAEPLCSSCVPTDHSSASLSRSFSTGTHLITVAYSGDTLGNFSSVGGPVSLVVNAASSSTTVSSSANPSVHGQNVTFTAVVTSSGDAPSGSVQFQIDGNDTGVSQPVDASGHASLDVSSLDVGNHAVEAVFASNDANVLGSTGVLTAGFFAVPQVVNPAETTTVVSSSANPSEFGQNITFTATEAALPPGAGTPTGTIQFEDNGVPLGGPQNVGGGGQASLTTAGLAVGPHTVSATYVSDSPNFEGSSGSVDQTVSKARTTLVYDGATTSDFNDSASLSARLERTDNGAPIAGETINFAMASETCTKTTDAGGEAACSITPTEAAASFTVAAGFAGDDDYLPASGSSPFVVTREETTTAYVGPTVIAQGGSVTLAGRLLEDGVTAITGRTLTLTIGIGAAAQSCVAGPTDASGTAQCTIAAVTVPQGPQPLSADFAGDNYYLPSRDASKTAIVFAFPSHGVFVIGDRTAAETGSPNVTFWGAGWSTLNVLSGGAAPSSFKGFATSPSPTLPTCGGTWTTGPGNSSSPVDALPTYMGTVVSSSIAKSGSTISGTLAGIVVIVTTPGYAPDPGHPGTGTVVATYCEKRSA